MPAIRPLAILCLALQDGLLGGRQCIVRTSAFLEAALHLPVGGIQALSVWFRLREPKMEELEVSPKGVGDR